MVVQHNLTAMNSNRMLGLTSKGQAKSTEKLSSGYKINRAADDAAGLAISEKMRKQIRGLAQASANAQDGISAVQTAEGALTEVHDMLQRMNELAVKAANGTNSESDRKAIQQEIDQLTTEIDRVAETTKFNETYLLKGDRNAPMEASYSYSTFTNVSTASGSFATDSVTGLGLDVIGTAATITNMDAQNDLIKALKTAGVNLTAYSNYGTGTVTTTFALSLNGDAANKYDVVSTAAASGQFDIYSKTGELLMSLKTNGTYQKTATQNGDVSDTITLNAFDITAAQCTDAEASYYDAQGNRIATNDLDSYFTTYYSGATDTAGSSYAKAGAPKVYDAVGNVTDLVSTDISTVRDKIGTLDVSLHVGADATQNNQITLNLDAMNAKGLGINGLKMDGPDDSNALDSIERIKAAIDKVSAQRSTLGAIQNRLEHTINNLDNVVENTTSAESAIRDTDMASEMVKYSNNNILSQAGQSMLAQANQSNQGVLSLLS